MADLVAMVPVKALSRAKTRLQGFLTPEERRAVSLEMLEAVATQLGRAASIGRWGVVSADEDALDLARGFGGEAVVERESSLNAALDVGRQWALTRAAAGRLLVVLSDVPLIDAAGIDAFVEAASRDGAAVAIAPSQDGGTNALLLRPPEAIPFGFGPRSAAKHRWEATRRGLPVRLVRLESLAFDVDTPEDYERYRRLQKDGVAHQTVAALAAADRAAR